MSDKSVTAPIAIVGIAGRFPGADNPQQLFRNLLDGVDAIKHFEDAELEDHAAAAQRALPNYVKARPILEEVENFDAGFFGMQPREAELTDPQQRVFLECSWEALEDAGYDPARYHGSIGVFGGSSMNTYFLHHVLRDRAALEEFTSAFQVGCYQQLVGAVQDFVATRVAYKLDLRGPAVTVQSACSTSLLAIAQAVQSLQLGHCDMALAGGVSITFPQRRGYLHQEGGMVSGDGTCRPFDAKASGTVFGSGAAVLLLKRLDQAQADGDHVYAVIRGIGVNNDGAGKVGFTAPSVDGQARCVEMALRDAKLQPADIGYVECHGTATPLGDPIEIAALAQAHRSNTQPGSCIVGSLKSNVGHLDAAAGATGLIKVALALKHERLPGTLHFEQSNPQIDFASSPFAVQAQAREWPRAAQKPRRAGVSSLGVGGTNVHLIVEEAPPTAARQPDRSPQVLLLSGRDARAQEQASTRLAAHLQANPEISLADVAYTLQEGRRGFSQRRALVCRDVADAIAQLTKADAPLSYRGEAGRAPGVAFMFPGQGAQYPGMAKNLYAQEPVFRAEFDRCTAVLKARGVDLDTLIYGDQATAEALQKTSAAQPALFTIEYAIARLWESRGLQPAAMIGHSVGEFVAAVLAGVMQLEDALAVVAERGRLMQALPGGAMLAARLKPEDLQPRLDSSCAIAAINAPGLCVAAGPFDAIEALEKSLAAENVICRRLHTSHAFHSPMVDPVVAPLRELLSRIELSPPSLPYISCVSGDWVTAEQATSPDYWARHAREAVRFADGVAKLAEKTGVLLECGPGDSLSRLARQSAPQRRCINSLPDAANAALDVETLLAAAGGLWTAGVAIDWKHWRSADAQPQRVSLPTYPFQRQRHWIEAPDAAARGTVPALAPIAMVTVQAADEETPGTPRRGTEADVAAIIEELSGRALSGAAATTSFLDLGFDSLFLAQVTQRLQSRLGVAVNFRQLLGELPTLHTLAAWVDERRAPAPAVAAADESKPVTPAEVPLTESQMEIWLAAQTGDAASCAFNQSITLRLRGALDERALRLALDGMVSRHDALRARFSPTGERMVLANHQRLDCPKHDFSNGGAAAAEARLALAAAEDMRTPFDLVNGPLLRLQLCKLGDDAHALLLTTHHIVCDGWSLNVLARDLAQAYERACRDQPASNLPGSSYLEYAAREQEPAPDFAATEAYWTQQFANLPPLLDLPADRSRPAERSLRGARHRTVLSKELCNNLKRVGAQNHSTLFVTLLAMYQALIGRLAGENEVVIGVPTAGQAQQSNPALVGHCVHFLPLRARWNDNTSLAAHLQAQARHFADAAAHPRYTLATLLRRLNIKRPRGRLPLAEVQFNFESRLEPLAATGLAIEVESNPKSYVNPDLCLNVLETEDGLQLDCDYSTDLFDESTIERWMGCYTQLLQALVERPQQPLARAPLLPANLRDQVLNWFNATHADYPREATLPQLFDTSAEQHADAIALRCGNDSISYCELQAQANRLAQLIVQRCGSGQRIGVLLERSLQLPAVLLAVLKAGSAYVPLDPAHPPARLSRILADAGVAAVLCDRAPAGGLVPADIPLIRLDQEQQAIAEMPAVTPAVQRCADDAAYLIYTSGSTGTPKGVQIGHRAMVNFLTSMAAEPGLSSKDVLLAVTTISFDIAVLEIFGPLLNGACAVLATREEAGNGDSLRALIERHGVSLMQATPATWSMLLEAGFKAPAGFRMLCGGEALPRSLADSLLEGEGELWNMYGPTETTVWSSCVRVLDNDAPITVGRPIANTSFYVLDNYGEPQPPGVPGELYIGGDGVAHGYHNRAQLNAAKFVANPFGPGRLYRTGDLARCLPGGEYQVIGRADHQVKLRGFRIELGEIEACLRKQPGVAEAAVILREDTPGAPRLAAYTVTRGPCPPAQLRAALKQELPEYMVPTAWMSLDALPRLPNGKLDRKALPAPDTSAAPIEYAPPSTPMEQRLARIWAEVLHMEHVSVHLDLIEYGADSLQLFQITARAHRDGLKLSARQLLEARTIAALAPQLDAGSAANPVAVDPAAPPATRGKVSLSQFLKRGAAQGNAGTPQA